MSTSEHMVELLHQIEERSKFDNDVDEWRQKPKADRTWTAFQEHFADANRVHRHWKKVQCKSACASGYDRASHIEELEKKLDAKLVTNVADIALAAEETI